MLTTTTSYIEVIDHELAVTYYAACDKKCDICDVSLYCHYENQHCSEHKKMWNPDKASIIDRELTELSNNE
jgi:hypothetical protein